MKRDQRVCTRTLGLFYVSQAGSHKTQAPKYKHVPTRNFTAFFCTKLQFHHPLQILWFLMNDNKQYQNFSLCQNLFKLLLDQIQRTISIITGMNIKVKSTQSHSAYQAKMNKTWHVSTPSPTSHCTISLA